LFQSETCVDLLPDRFLEPEPIMAVTPDKPAPYATGSAILDLIGRHRDRGLPAPVNGDVLARAGIAETLIPRTLQALQTLDLIDSETGMPTSTFEAIRLAPQAEYQKRLEDWLKGTYADVFSFVDPTKDDETSIRDAFRSYQPVGQQGRMVALFQALCTAAGLIAEKAARPSPSFTLQQRAAASRVIAKLKNPPRASAPVPGVPPAISGLLASLPAEGTGWTAPKRDSFLKTFSTVLDFLYPVLPHEPDEDEEVAEATEAPIKRRRVL
jgi:hypothetical protein